MAVALATARQGSLVRRHYQQLRRFLYKAWWPATCITCDLHDLGGVGHGREPPHLEYSLSSRKSHSWGQAPRVQGWEAHWTLGPWACLHSPAPGLLSPRSEVLRGLLCRSPVPSLRADGNRKGPQSRYAGDSPAWAPDAGRRNQSLGVYSRGSQAAADVQARASPETHC